MGLDIYLYKYENFEDTQKREQQYEKKSESLWTKDYNATPESEKVEIRQKAKQLAAKLGLDEDGQDSQKTKIEFDSKTNPEHYFKIGYFRSSYNDGGMNRVLENLGIDGLYEIFEPKDRYEFQPNWAMALPKVSRAIRQLESRPNLRCFDVSENIFGTHSLPQSEKEAIDIYMEQKKRTNSFGSYSNRDGQFFMDEPLKVFALINGETNVLGKRKCVYVVTDGENTFYLEALKIVKETIEYVLSQPDKEKYYLHWSS